MHARGFLGLCQPGRRRKRNAARTRLGCRRCGAHEARLPEMRRTRLGSRHRGRCVKGQGGRPCRPLRPVDSIQHLGRRPKKKKKKTPTWPLAPAPSTRAPTPRLLTHSSTSPRRTTGKKPLGRAQAPRRATDSKAAPRCCLPTPCPARGKHASRPPPPPCAQCAASAWPRPPRRRVPPYSRAPSYDSAAPAPAPAPAPQQAVRPAALDWPAACLTASCRLAAGVESRFRFRPLPQSSQTVVIAPSLP